MTQTISVWFMNEFKTGIVIFDIHLIIDIDIWNNQYLEDIQYENNFGRYSFHIKHIEEESPNMRTMNSEMFMIPIYDTKGVDSFLHSLFESILFICVVSKP